MSDKERWEREKEYRQYMQRRLLAEETLDGELTEEMIDAEICKRLKDDVDDEYLVDGAVLFCGSAQWGDFKLSDGDVIKIDGVEEKRKTGIATEYLRVPENKMSVNGLRYATVADTKRDWNIMPFPCNCREPASPEQEKIIKENKVDCQSHGVCKYLMDLEEEWENYDFKENLSFSAPVPYSDPVPISISVPVQYEDYMDETAPDTLGDMQMSEIWSRDSAQKKKGITMTSVLFCKHGGFIYPRTSGQTVVQEDISEFLSTYQFTGKQYMALYEIKDYMARYPELRQGTAIFVFEGLATPVPLRDENLKDKNDPRYEWNWNGTNSYHPNRQFGAIIIVTVDGKLDCAAMKASTLPDNMEKATICEGIYEVCNTAHSRKTDGGYAALTLNNDLDIPAYNSKTGNDYANLVHFHMAGPLYTGSAYSLGCITMPVREYVAFGKQVGFISEGTDDKIGEDNNYTTARGNLLFSSHTKKFNGYMVIDRQYYIDKVNDQGEKYLKFNGSRGQE